MNPVSAPRPSRTYRDGVGKPVVAKRYDEVVRAYRWDVVFPPCNNFGVWIVEPEARLVAKALVWCHNMNYRLQVSERDLCSKMKEAQ